MVLEENEELEEAYRAVAIRGDTSPPENPEEDVDYHYICWATNDRGDILYELDGERSCPWGRLPLPPDSNMLSEIVLNNVRTYMKAEEGKSLAFSLMALCGESG